MQTATLGKLRPASFLLARRPANECSSFLLGWDELPEIRDEAPLQEGAGLREFQHEAI